MNVCGSNCSRLVRGAHKDDSDLEKVTAIPDLGCGRGQGRQYNRPGSDDIASSVALVMGDASPLQTVLKPYREVKIKTMQVAGVHSR